MTRSATGLLLLLLMSAACSSDPPARMIVNLRTDLVAGREFRRIYVDRAIGGEIPDPVPVLDRSELAVRPLANFTEGRRVADWDAPPSGTVTVRVRLLDRDLAVVSERTARVQSDGRSISLTIVIARSCLGVSCPDGSSCHAGSCGDPACPEDPSACPDDECALPADCSSAVPCATADCVAGECVRVTHDDRCPIGSLCDVGVGCVPDPDPDDDGGGIITDPPPGPDPPPACGDGVCELGYETVCECPADCVVLTNDGCCSPGENACNEWGCEPLTRGDGCCHPLETNCNEPLCVPKARDNCCSVGETRCDDEVCTEPCPTCGDGICQDAEHCSGCPSDCEGLCECRIRCCDGTVIITQSDTPEQCLSRGMCEPHGFTWHRRWQGMCVYQRDTHCGCCGNECPGRCEDRLTCADRERE